MLAQSTTASFKESILRMRIIPGAHLIHSYYFAAHLNSPFDLPVPRNYIISAPLTPSLRLCYARISLTNLGRPSRNRRRSSLGRHEAVHPPPVA